MAEWWAALTKLKGDHTNINEDPKGSQPKENEEENTLGNDGETMV